MIKKLWQKLFGVPGAAHTGATPVILTDIYDGPDGWHFSFTTPDHKDGGVWGPYRSQREAEDNRERFVSSRKGTTEFVHQGVPYRTPDYYRRVIRTGVSVCQKCGEPGAGGDHVLCPLFADALEAVGRHRIRA